MSVQIPSILREFFVEAPIPLTLTDPNQPDEPLIFANKPFYEMLGTTADEVLGKNCRFMQSEETSKYSRNTIRGDFAANRDSKVLIRNQRKNGQTFDNFLYIFTLFEENDRPVFRIGSQFELPQTKRAHAFEAHHAQLVSRIEALNYSAEKTHSRLIDTDELLAMTVKSLLVGRLESLRAA